MPVFRLPGYDTALYLFFPMDYPIHIDAISMELSILYFKGLPVKIFYKLLKIVLVSANSADTDEMPPKLAFHIWVFTIWQCPCLPVSRMKRVTNYNSNLLQCQRCTF